VSTEDEDVWARRRRLGEMLRRWASPGEPAPSVKSPADPAQADIPEPKRAATSADPARPDIPDPKRAATSAGVGRSGGSEPNAAESPAGPSRSDAADTTLRRAMSPRAEGDGIDRTDRPATGRPTASDRSSELAARHDESAGAQRDTGGSRRGLAGGRGSCSARRGDGARRGSAGRGGDAHGGVVGRGRGVGICAWRRRLRRWMRALRRTEDRGAATIFVLAVGLVLVAAGIAGAAVGSARIGRHRAQAAADLGALAGAAQAIEGADAACGQAARFVAANSGRVTSCEVNGLEIVIRTNVTITPLPGLTRHAEAAARAGPVYPLAS
jgi:secretion/DNA translocation related TadE-like protein